ncbi:hypothetical protein MITS9509_03102 [Synechococcus sp. MIT S9509]|nr:hypothetical protein MITS9504_03173 [Synechococcus sp. MIT S9504]KZR89033.1 hypothetical protein MITS9509_03102 [Synechococcus sp. MIT S9509]
MVEEVTTSLLYVSVLPLHCNRCRTIDPLRRPCFKQAVLGWPASNWLMFLVSCVAVGIRVSIDDGGSRL